MNWAECNDVQLLVANFCIAEVFSVFEKYRWGAKWNPHVKRSNFKLSQTDFESARRNFRAAIHNGSKIVQVELNRYHVLCVDLISTINHAYQINRPPKSARRVVPASTYDMLLLAMGIWLTHVHGRENLTIVTGDNRITDVVGRARSIKLNKEIRSHLTSIADSLGLTYSPDLYPFVLNLKSCTQKELFGRFPWLRDS
ncbi:MAG TPA: hypothetical protein VJ570_04015 [Holophagaceae bacterium]|nr:hypothetical protein [Holophagaceae bacterium]